MHLSFSRESHGLQTGCYHFHTPFYCLSILIPLVIFFFPVTLLIHHCTSSSNVQIAFSLWLISKVTNDQAPYPPKKKCRSHTDVVANKFHISCDSCSYLLGRCSPDPAIRTRSFAAKTTQRTPQIASATRTSIQYYWPNVT